MLQRLFLSFVTLALTAGAQAATPHAPPVKKVLLIGIDGLRLDAMLAANTPNLDRLIGNGAFADNTSILADRPTANDTVSGPGWSSILTGVWADKHGVQDNALENQERFEAARFEQFPHFFRRIKDADPQARTGSFVSWKPIAQHMVSAADVSFGPPTANGDDDLTVNAAADFISRDDPTAVFVHLLHVDHQGHTHGFHPTVPEYVEAIEDADRHVGQLVEAVRARDTHVDEDWLILVGTDHGGKGTTHQNGRYEPEVTHVFLIVSGKSAIRDKIAQPTAIIDLAVTALAHLEIAVSPAWELDGRAVGLKYTPRGNDCGIFPNRDRKEAQTDRSLTVAARK